MRATLNALAVAAPDWLRLHADPAWIDRYGRPAGDYHIPLGEAARQAYAEKIGRDGHALLAAVAAPDAPAWLREVPSVMLLRRVWIQNFCLVPAEACAKRGMDGPGEDGMLVRWCTTVEGFPTSLLMVASPYDPDVHYAKKRSTKWIGYKVHLTETCDDERPRLITHVETTPAPVVDRDALGPVHGSLAAKGLLPDKHFVDTGYMDADQLVASARDHGVALIGPTLKDNQWQARTEGAFTIQDFTLDWDGQLATCPAGHTSRSWTADHNQGRTVMRIRFSTTKCKPCALHPRSRPPADAKAARGARGAGSSPDTRDRKGVHRRISPSCRHRGHVVVGRAGHAPAPCALPRARQNPPAARAHGCRHEPLPPWLLARKHTTRENTPIRLRPAYGHASPHLTTSPADQPRAGRAPSCRGNPALAFYYWWRSSSISVAVSLWWFSRVLRGSCCKQNASAQ